MRYKCIHIATCIICADTSDNKQLYNSIGYYILKHKMTLVLIFRGKILKKLK